MTSTHHPNKGIPMLLFVLCLPMAYAFSMNNVPVSPPQKDKWECKHPPGPLHAQLHHPYDPHLQTVSKSAPTELNTCENIGFELNDFSGWIGMTGENGEITANGIISGRHTLTNRGGIDPVVPTLSTVAPGSHYSVRLGNDGTDYEVDRLTTSFQVTADNNLFSYQFAVVLEDPGHTPEEQPRFEIAAFDENGVLIPCTYYLVIAAEDIEGFQSLGDIRYRDWSTVSLDLSQYIGQKVTIRFTTVDCAKGGHFGYAYIDAECMVAELSIKCNDLAICENPAAFCADATSYTITAPPGFNNYHWSTGETTRAIKVEAPIPGTLYSVSFNNFTSGEFGDCMINLDMTIPTPPPPPVIASDEQVYICRDAPIQLDAGADFSHYNWSNGLHTQTITIENIGDYSVTVTDAHGCRADKDINVSKGTDPQISVSKIDASCVDQADGSAAFTLLNHLEGIGVQWSTGANTPEIEGLSAGEYCLTVSDAIGCSVTECIQITTPPPLSIITEPIDNPCYGFSDGRINIQTSGGVAPYLHAVGSNSFYPTNTFGGLAAGEYTVTVQDANGCTLSQRTHIQEPPELRVDVGADLFINLSETAALEAITNFPVETYHWDGDFWENCQDCPDPSVRPFYSTIYKVTVTDATGCQATDQLNVFVAKPRNVFIPNGFSPNNDSSNDIFFINASEEVALIRSFQIYSRWGELIKELSEFQPNDPSFGWDGRHQGKLVNPGVYVYAAEIEFIDGVRMMFKGDVTLVR